jgi:RNA polymerase sigma-70 factor (ECF subfamily)
VKNETDPFRTLYDANHQRVRGLLARMVGPHEAEDLTQAVFAKVAKALPDFHGESQTSTWLYRITVNVASDWLRSRCRQEAKLTVLLPSSSDEDMRASGIGSPDVDSQPTPEQELSHKEIRACLEGEIGKLPDAHRVALMMSALGGLADDEIAEVLGISLANTKVRLHRARQEFKKIIAARCDFYRNELSCKPASSDCCASPTPPDSARSPR